MSVEYIGSDIPEFEQHPPHQVETLGIEPQIKTILERIGEDPNRQGLLNTPHRVDKALAFLTSGYRANLEKEINGAIFDEADSEHFDEMVLVKEIEFYSLCEHHMIPFFGKVHIAYIPNRKIIGLSKLPRIVEIFARRLQVQERLTQQIARCVDEVLSPYGVAVVAEARHMCMCMRGIQKQSSWTTTSSMLGAFRENPQTRSEFLNLIKS
jgi:GTP cyclohydrolase IA